MIACSSMTATVAGDIRRSPGSSANHPGGTPNGVICARASLPRMVLTMEGEPGPVRTSESYPNESGKRYLSLRRRITEEVERIVVQDGLPGDERHGRAVPSHRSLR